MEREENKEDVLAENTEKEDQFELIYWKLSYRRRFGRDLLMIPVVILVNYMIWDGYAELPFLYKVAGSIIMTAIWAVPAGYNYIRWKREKKK